MEPEKRIRRACARCRRQKLKCDNERPCPLCVRAKAECVEATERTRRSNRIHSTPRRRPELPTQPGESILNMAGPASTESSSKYAHSATSFEDEKERSRFNDRRDGKDRDSNISSREDSSQGSIGAHGDHRASAIHVVEKIFQQYRDSAPSKRSRTDAIPDSTADHQAGVAEATVPVKSLIGIDLPSEPLVNTLLDAYLESMHWYLAFFHIPTFRARLNPILATGMAPSTSRPFLLLFLLVMTLGIDAVITQEKEETCPGVKLDELKDELVATAERWFLPSMENLTVETVAYSFLIFCRNLMARQTKVAHVTMVTTVRAAQSIGLHRESLWTDIHDPIERNMRRRLWWNVFIGAGFISVSWGSAPLITVADCSVRLPEDLPDDNSSCCPGLQSMELREDGTMRPVTVDSYNRYKAKLYMIANSIMRDVYFSRRLSRPRLFERIRGYHKRLLDWERTIPQELRPESYAGRDLTHDPILRLYAVQAFTLRLSYDNTHIILFRPFVSPNERKLVLKGDEDTSSTQEPSPPESVHGGGGGTATQKLVATARNQCWTSAMRTSQLGEHLDIVDQVGHSLASVYIGVHAFSAGVMLSLLCLSDPMSSMAQESKRGMARLIQISGHLHITIWKQMADVLTELMHVIATEETKALIQGQTASASPTKQAADVATYGYPPDEYPEVPPDSGNANYPVPQTNMPLQPSLPGVPTTYMNQNPDMDMYQAPYNDEAFQSMPNDQMEDSPMGLRFSDMQPAGLLGGVPDIDQMWMWDNSYSYL